MACLCGPQVLFYEDPTPFKALEEKFPMLKNEFPECMFAIWVCCFWAGICADFCKGSHVTSGMHQYAGK